MGLDEHTTDIFDEIHDFVADVAPFDVQITYPTPFPGTPLYDRLADEGRLTHDLQWDRCTLFDINFQPLNMSGAQLREGFHRLTRELYNADFTKRRQSSFKKQWRKGRAA